MDIATDFNYTQLDPTLDELLARFAALGKAAGDGAETLHRRYGKAFETPYWRYFFMPKVDEIGCLPSAAKRISISTKLPDFGRLGEYQRLESVAVHDRFSTSSLDVVSRLGKLSHLEVWNYSFKDIRPLKALPNLRHLVIRESRELASLGGLQGLKDLRTLVLEGTPQLRDIGVLSSLDSLLGLEVRGGLVGINYRSLTLEKLAPIGMIPNLKVLRLHAVRADDADLSPLTRLAPLEDIELSPKEFPLDTMAVLAAAFENLENEWAVPLGEAIPCKQCQTLKKVLIGYRSRDICPSCHPERLERFLARFRDKVHVAKAAMRMD